MNKLSLFAIAVVVSAGLTVGCKNCKKCDHGDKAAFDIATAKAEIAARNQVFMDAFNAGDSVALANCYAKDAKIMGPNAPAVSGSENILREESAFLSMGKVDVKVSTVNLWGNEDLLVEEGAFIIKDTAGKVLDQGKQIEVWTKEDGTWKILRDCFNSDLPLPASQ